MLSIITFLAAFLLFQIELITAKLFLPVYGGSYLVWGACVVFFQAVLLLGYIFAHFMIEKKGIAKYLKLHLVLLVIPFLFFPGRPIHISYQEISLPLVIDVFIRLLLTIGPVFFVLSTVSLVTQSWHANARQSRSPYFLYAVSNLGSFAALLSYPFAVEFFLTNTQQLNIWRGLYVGLVLLTFAAWKFLPVDQKPADAEKLVLPSKADLLQWLLLGAGGVIMFLSVTNIISYEVAPVPLLWVIPLSIYLLAFVLNFKERPWCPSWIKNNIAVILGLSVAVFFLTKIVFFPPLLTVILLNLLLFFICMYTQNRLIQLKPHQGSLTLFYVFISLGGFLGGVVTTWIIPLVTNNLAEFLFGMLVIGATIFPKPSRIPRWTIIPAVLLLSVLVFWPQVFKAYSLKGFLLLSICLGISFFLLSLQRIVFLSVLAVLVIISSPLESLWKGHKSIAKDRNYYGIYDIYDTNDNMRVMVHGTTLHGIEFMDPKRAWIPLGYYAPTSPVGEILGQDFFKAKSVAGVGLGAGTIAMYTKTDISMDFYELDPDVVELARTHFGYLALAPGPVEVIAGDARVSLNARPDKKYDVIIVDAFGGDAIPFHLINTDVVFKYLEHLNEKGGIMFHIPSRYFNLEPVLAAIAKHTGAYGYIKESKNEGFGMQSVWSLMVWDKVYHDQLIERGWRPLTLKDGFPVWSDDYSSILPVLKLDDLFNSLKYFHLLRW